MLRELIPHIHFGLLVMVAQVIFRHSTKVIFCLVFKLQKINRVFTADAKEPEVVFCVAFTQLEHTSWQRTKTQKGSKSQKLRGGKPSTE